MKYKIGLAVLLCALFVTGCGKEPPLEMHEATEYTMVSLAETVAAGGGTQEGFYRFCTNADGSTHILYIDYASQKEVVLCAQPNCLHRDENCTGWYPPGSHVNGVFPMGEALVVQLHGATVLSAVPHFETMSAAGGERALLAEFPNAAKLDANIAVGEARFVFVLTENPSENSALQTRQALVEVQLGTRTAKVLAQLPFAKAEEDAIAEKTSFLRGVCADGWVIKTLTAGAGATMQEIQQGQLHTVFLLPFQATKLKELYTYQQGEMTETVCGGIIYRMRFEPSGQANLESFHPQSKKKQVLQKDMENFLPETTYLSSFDASHVVLLAESDDFTIAGERFVYDTAAKSLSPLKLQYQFFNVTEAVRVLGATESQFLVVCGKVPVMQTLTAPDGTTYESQGYQEQLALIAKEDYFSSTESFTLLEACNTFGI